MADRNVMPWVSLLLLLVCSQLAVSRSPVKFLPGFDGPLPFELETGYVGVGDNEEVQLFYYFIKSQGGNPKKDPLLLWLTGGPGCSALSPLVNEIGPLNFKLVEYNGSLPTLVLTPHTWTKVASIIFVDSPVGTGFSYARDPSASQSSDLKQVDQLNQFFRKWLRDHPGFLSNPFYVGGDSYSGITVPLVAQRISNGNREGIKPLINLQGYILGNPLTSQSYINYRIPFSHGMGLISDELYESLKRNCGGEYETVDPSNPECLKDLEAYDKCTSGIYTGHILLPSCELSSPKPRERFGQRRYLSELSQESPAFELPPPRIGCPTYPYFLLGYWVIDDNVQKALHIRKGSFGKWKRCNHELPYTQNIKSSLPCHVNLSAAGYPSLIYSGDHDLTVPFLGTQAWIRSLDYSIVDDWRPWMLRGQIAGYTRTYSNKMTFATIKGGGHTAEYTPEECSVIFKRWIGGEPL